VNDYKQIKLAYTTNVDFYTGNIYEYDMKGAFIVFTKNFCSDILSEDELIHLNDISPNKRQRNIYIGILQRKHKRVLAERLNDLLRYFLHRFIVENKINETDIMSIKKDALFVKKRCDVLVFDSTVTFVEKNNYNYFVKYRTDSNKELELYTNEKGYSLKGAQNISKQNTQLFKVLKTTLVKFNELSLSEFIVFSRKLLQRLDKSDPMFLSSESVVVLSSGFELAYGKIKNTKYEKEISYSVFVNEYFVPLVNKLIKRG